MSDIKRLSPELVLRIHDSRIEKYGGIKGIRDEGLFSQLCEAPYEGFAGVEFFLLFLKRLPNIWRDLRDTRSFWMETSAQPLRP